MLTVQPVGEDVVEGGNFTFTVAASGSPPPTYQWNHGGSPITDATTATLTLDPVTPIDAGDYSVVASNSAGSVRSATATLRIKTAVTPTSITTQPSDITLHGGENLVLAVAVEGSEPFSYQWKRDGIELPGGTASTLTVNSAHSTAAGDYTVTISGPGGTVASAAAHVMVVPMTIGMPTLDSGGVSLGLRTIAGRHYFLEAADDVNSAVWENLVEVIADGDGTVFTVALPGGNQLFWRYRVAP
ncbi:MAG: hypothetical protein EXS31_17540 [Pedosphaera sp.]|nr:hypothetical protein [Pedosphaera sp.]